MKKNKKPTFKKHHKPNLKSNSKSKNLSSQIDPNQLWLCGKHPVFLALKNKRRKIYEILVSKNSQNSLENFLKKHNLSALENLIKLSDNQQIEAILGNNQIHQGLAIRCSKLPTKNQNDLLEELYSIEEGQALPKLLLLDQISDPHNIGAIIRSAVGFGVNKIIFCTHNAPQENSTIVKSAAGTIEFADLITVTNFSNLIEKLKKIGYWCIGLAGEGKSSIKEATNYKNIALVIGSEGDGIRDLVKKNCDILAKIPIAKEVESLNASVATAIALYELTNS